MLQHLGVIIVVHRGLVIIFLDMKRISVAIAREISWKLSGGIVGMVICITQVHNNRLTTVAMGDIIWAGQANTYHN